MAKKRNPKSARATAQGRSPKTAALAPDGAERGVDPTVPVPGPALSEPVMQEQEERACVGKQPVAAMQEHALQQPGQQPAEQQQVEQQPVEQPQMQELAARNPGHADTAADRDRQPSAATDVGHRAAQKAGHGASLTDIRGVLIQLAGARLLLPNATIAEVLSYAPPESVQAGPQWLLGKMRWRGWQLPLVAFAELAGLGKEPAGLGSKVVVLKALAGNAQAPYFAILSQGFPRLVTVSSESLVADPDDAALPLGVQARVWLNDDTALVPDLQAVEMLIGDALAQAA